jgi:2-dehydro-3-deoxygluconokinase
MNYGLGIRDSATTDFICLGALVHRLDPGIVAFRKATEYQVRVSGGEFNVAANLSNRLGLRASIVTAVVRYEIRHMVAESLRAMGVTSFYKAFEHNGVTGPDISTVCSDRGYGIRGPSVFYNRADQAATQLESGAFEASDFRPRRALVSQRRDFRRCVGTTPELVVQGTQAAKTSGSRWFRSI